jgi:hypothetical protein
MQPAKLVAAELPNEVIVFFTTRAFTLVTATQLGPFALERQLAPHLALLVRLWFDISDNILQVSNRK